MIYLTAQSDDYYYTWQLAIQFANFRSLNIRKEQIHVLFSFDPEIGLKEDVRQFLIDHEHAATFFLYADDREQRRYRSSVRPNIIKKHYAANPYLEKEAVFYHDCDIVFSRDLPLERLLADEHWYFSDTSIYTGVTYLQQFGTSTVETLAGVIGIDPNLIFDNDSAVGGAQCLIKNATVSFWECIERDSEALYAYMEDHTEDFCFDGPAGKVYIQSWCSDMWAMLWNAWRFSFAVKVPAELDFCWPERPLAEWETYHIFHNTGITAGSRLFDKTRFIKKTPLFRFYDEIDHAACQIRYIDMLHDYEKSYYRDLSDVSVLFQIKVDSDERAQNLNAALHHISRYFKVNIVVVEVGEQQRYFPEDIPGLTFRFVQDPSNFLNFAKYWNMLCTMVETPYIVLHDADIIVNPEQLYRAIVKLRFGGYALCLPYDGTFVNIENPLREVYMRDAAMSVLVHRTPDNSNVVNNSVGGCVALNREAFLEAGASNERIIGWGPDDKERMARIKILGYKTGRIPGEIYHLFHPRNAGSTYPSTEMQLAGYDEYLRICSSRRKELSEYVSKW